MIMAVGNLVVWGIGLIICLSIGLMLLEGLLLVAGAVVIGVLSVPYAICVWIYKAGCFVIEQFANFWERL